VLFPDQSTPSKVTNNAPVEYGSVKALVTGGAGFIGSNLADALLARGDEVVIVDNLASGKKENVNPEAELREHDIREPFATDADVIFHLAAQADVQTSMQRPEYDAAVNVIGTVNVLNAARGAQVIFASSGGAGYGECPGPVDETFRFEPLSPYGIAKKCGEEYLAGWNRIHGTSHVALRFANVYGPRQDAGLEGGVVSIFLERMAKGEPTTIYGDGGQSRDFVYVDDVVRACLAAAGNAGGPFNVGTGRETSIRELHAACAKVAGVPDEPQQAEARLGDVQRSVIDSSRAERELGFRAQTSLEDGLARTWDWLTRS
jgi:UDP-glucose 4-epimerase